MVWELVIAGLAGLDAVMGWMDARITNKGIKAGIGVEANEVITTIFRTDKPSLTQLCVYNALQMGVFLGVGLFLHHLPADSGWHMVARARRQR